MRNEVVGHTSEPVRVSAPREGWFFRLKDACAEYSPPTDVKVGNFHVEPGKHAKRGAIDLHNLALEKGYESELIQHRNGAFQVLVRQAGVSNPAFMSDPMLGLEMPKTDGVFLRH